MDTESLSLQVTSLDSSIHDTTEQVHGMSQRVYKSDARALTSWIAVNGIDIQTFDRSDAIAYKAYLEEIYQKATAKRMLSVARRIFQEYVIAGKGISNPFSGLRPIKVNNESTHVALIKQQAKDLLSSIDGNTRIGKRDYALVSLLLRTGIRRSECVALNIGDIKQEQGHTIAIIQHGKGDKRRKVKIPVDVFRSLQAHIDDVYNGVWSLESPLFVGFDRWGRPTGERISTKLVERIVKQYGEMIGVTELTPHGLRASFITLALEEGATLLQVQYAAGHDDPRTTERYHKRKLNLDDNAVDKLAFLSRD